MIRWYVKADGAKVLQESCGGGKVGPYEWRDVPTEVEAPEPRKPREWWLRLGGKSDIVDFAYEPQNPALGYWVKVREAIDEP